jgi:2-polyprenyl-6-methoxyphenol hydroxylase-like FAD-dependent oxidoreductase
VIPNPLRDELQQSGYLPTDYPYFRLTGRRWSVDDGTDAGRTLWLQPGQGSANNWSVLWRSLRAGVDDTRYRDATAVVSVQTVGDRVVVIDSDGHEERYDVVFGADGYRSTVRSTVDPNSRPEYAGYVLWRGNFAETELADRRAWDQVVEEGVWLTVCFDGGHGVMYPIPDFEGDGGQGRRVNWAIYAPQPRALDLEGPSSVPPGQVSADVYAELEALIETHVPPRLRPVFTSPRHGVSIQPIYDETIRRYRHGHVAVIGDAATVSRPHTGSGATKAMQDALCLESLGAVHDDWAPLLDAYDADRTATGQALVELGRRIGRDQVEQTPPWSEMTPADFDDWTKATLSGEQLYFYANAEEQSTTD